MLHQAVGPSLIVSYLGVGGGHSSYEHTTTFFTIPSELLVTIYNG